MGFWHRLADVPAGRSAWLVVGASLVLTVTASPLAREVSDVYENDVSSWVPRAAESTRARELASRFPGGQELTAVVVYARAGGLTDADRAKAAVDRRVLAGLIPGRRIQPPVASPDGQALLDVLTPVMRTQPQSIPAVAATTSLPSVGAPRSAAAPTPSWAAQRYL